MSYGEMHVIRLLNGMELPVPEGMTPDQAYWRHVAMAVTEGLCPNHGAALRPEPALPGTGGKCVPCNAWFYLQPDGERAAMDVVLDPWGEPIWHAWMTGRA